MSSGIGTVQPRMGDEGKSEPAIPRLVEGVRLLGEYEGSGFREPQYLVARPDQQMILVSRLLYVVASVLDGRRDVAEVAEHASAEYGRRLSPDGLRYLVDNKLHPLGIASLGQDLRKPPRANPLLALTLRGVLIPPRGSRALGALFAPLFLPPFVVIALLALVAGDTLLIMRGGLDAAIHTVVGDPLYILPLLSLVTASALFHEFGHAAGCRYGGAQPGAIGVGIYLVFPAFFTNVTDAYRLNRRGRLRTDLGGIYFNAIFVVAMTAAYLLTGYPPLLVAIFLGHIEAVQQLIPLVRLDGYYILGDIVGIPNLFGQIRPILRSVRQRRSQRDPVISALRTRVRVIVTAWVFVVVPTLAAAVILIIIRLPRYASTAWDSGNQYWQAAATALDRGDVVLIVLAGFALLTLVLPWLGLSILSARMLNHGVRALARRLPHSRGQDRRARPAPAEPSTIRTGEIHGHARLDPGLAALSSRTSAGHRTAGRRGHARRPRLRFGSRHLARLDGESGHRDQRRGG